MDDALRHAVELFNSGRFSEFQDAMEKVAAATRAVSERHFYGLLGNLADATRARLWSPISSSLAGTPSAA